MSKRKSSGSINIVVVLALVLYIFAYEMGLRPGQRLLEITCAVISLALNEGSASAEPVNQPQTFVVTRRTHRDFELSYGRYKAQGIPGATKSTETTQALRIPVTTVTAEEQKSAPQTESIVASAESPPPTKGREVSENPATAQFSLQ